MSDKGFRVEIPVNIKRDRPTGKAAKREPQHEGQQDAVPRLARLLALAHKWEGMVQRGKVKNYTEIAHAAGLEPYDIVVSIDGITVQNFQTLEILLIPGSEHDIRIIRRGKRQALTYVTDGSRPKEENPKEENKGELRKF